MDDGLDDGLDDRLDEELNERLLALFRQHPDAMYQLDQSGRIVAANDALRALTRSDDLEGLELAALLEPADEVLRDLPRLTDGDARTYELHLQHADGPQAAVRLTHIPFLEDGTLIGIAGVVQDVSVENAALRALAESEARYRSLFEASGAGLAVAELDGRFVQANRVFCELVGYTEAELRRTDVSSLTHPDDRQRNLELIGQLVAGAVPSFLLEKRYVTRSGDSVWVRARVNLVEHPHAPAPQLLATVEDITGLKQTEARLERSESLLRIAGRKARVGGWSFDAATQRLFWSDEIFELLEHESGEPPRFERLMAQYPAHDRERLTAALDVCVRDGTPFDVEAEIETFRGRRLNVRVVAEAERGPDGRVARVIGAFQDVSELAAAHARTAELADRLTRTLESMTDALYVVDRDWRFTYVNRKAGELLERSPDDLLGRNLWEEFPAAVETALHGALRRARAEQTTIVLDEYHYPPLERWFEVNAYPAEEAVTVYFRDVTDERAARVALAEREERLAEQAALLDEARDAILVWDLDGRITYWNNRAERLYGWTAAEAMGRSVRELIYEDGTPFDLASATTLRDGEWVGELTQRTRDGQSLTVEARWTLVRDAADRPRSVMAITTDVTERKRLETQFLRAQRMESLGTLAGGIAHDLNNVLAPVMMAIELLKLDESEGRRLELLDTIASSTQRGADMIRQVLTFARGVEGKHQELDPAELLDDVTRILRDTLPRSIALDVDADDELWSIAGESTQLHQVLVNLAVNARDAMPSGGRLRFGAGNVTLDERAAAEIHGARPGSFVRFEVQDSGAGMTPEVVDRIFEPFFTTKPHGHGTGLGLSTSLAIVTSHEGFLHVESEPAKGTTFTLYLPAVSADGREERETAADVLPHGDGQLVLLVEDEDAVREVTRRTLESFDYRVLEATDGAEAITLFDEHRDDIALVLTDLMMPILDGRATIRALREMDPGVAIVAASGLHGNDRDEASELGVRAFLAKPFTAMSLATTLRDTLEPGG